MNKAMTDKIYSCAELRAIGMDTSAYRFLQEVCDFLRRTPVQGRSSQWHAPRLLFFEDGRHILTPIFWWQRPHGLWALPVGVRLLLHYERSPQGGAFLAQAREV